MTKKQITLVLISLLVGFAFGKFIFNGIAKKDNTNNESIEKHWTCSMHPEIDLLDFVPCPKCGMDLIPKETGASGLAKNEFKISKKAIALANVQTMIVGNSTDDVSDESALSLSGKIHANAKVSAMQTAHFGGRIEVLKYKSVGDYVSKGSLIATVYSPELVTAQNEFIEALEIKNEQPDLFLAVRNKLKNWKISENQINSIERDKKVITNFNMYANVSGYIDALLVEEGSHIKEGSPFFTVSNLNSVWAVFDVYEHDIKNIKIGQIITITANAYSEKEFNAKIDFISPVLNDRTRTLEVRATLDNNQKLFKPGMLLTSEIDISTIKQQTSIQIPSSAVMWTGKRSIVYIKTTKNQSTFELREIQIGDRIGESYPVLSGLKNGERIVVNGTFTIDAAAQLQGKNSMMNRDDTEKYIERFQVNIKFRKQLQVVFENYLTIKNAFVVTDANDVQKHAKIALVNLKKMPNKLLKKKKVRKIAMNSLNKVKMSIKSLVNEIDMDKQRHLFIALSNEMIFLTQSFGVEKTIYIQHCPMANEDQGADWLSTEEVIRNPYFGNEMLECGTVKKKIDRL